MTRDEQNDVIVSLSPELRRMAARYRKPGVDLDDLHQAAMIELWEVLRKGQWNPSRGTSLLGFGRRGIILGVRRESMRWWWVHVQDGYVRRRDRVRLGPGFQPCGIDPGFKAVEVRDAANRIQDLFPGRGMDALRLLCGIDPRGPMTEREAAEVMGLRSKQALQHHVQKTVRAVRCGTAGEGAA